MPPGRYIWSCTCHLLHDFFYLCHPLKPWPNKKKSGQKFGTHYFFSRCPSLSLPSPSVKNRTKKELTKVFHLFHVFSQLPPVTSIPTLANNYMLSRACHQLHAFPRLILVTYFPAVATPLHVFPRLILVTCFSALATRYMFSRAWYSLIHASPRLPPRYMFSRPWYSLHAFPRSPPVTCFPALDTHYMLSRACHP